MSIRDSVLFEDIINLVSNREGVGDTRFQYTLTMVTASGDFDVRKVNTVDIARDFVSRHADYLSLIVTLSRDEYENYVYPNRDDLTGQLIVESVQDKDGATSGEKATMLYRIKLDKVEDDGLAYGDSTGTDPGAKSQELKEIAVQLIDPKVERYRLKEIATVVHDTPVDDLLAVVLSDGNNFSVDIHPSDRKENIKQLIIPDGEIGGRLFNFPAWLQKFGGGVYEHNLGSYSLRGWNYVYPLFDTTPHIDRRKVTICSIGPGQMEGIDNTYSIEPGKLAILTTGKVEVVDKTEQLEFELGNEVRFQTPNLLKNGITHSNGVTTVNGAGYQKHGVNKQTLNNSRMVNRMTANPFYEMSRIASNRGVRATLKWGNANPLLIYPNMEVTVLYKTGEDVHSMKGIILGMDYKSSLNGSEGTTGTHTGDALLHLYLDQEVK